MKCLLCGRHCAKLLLSPQFILTAACKAGASITPITGEGGFPGSSDSNESACIVGDLVSIPGPGISPEVGKGNSLQCAERLEMAARIWYKEDLNPDF